MAEELHATYSPSGFEALSLCAGKLRMEQGKPNTTNTHSQEGTAAHYLLTWALEELVEGNPEPETSDWLGTVIRLDANGELVEDNADADFEIEVDDEMAGYVQQTVELVKDLAGDNGTVLVDRRVNFSRYLGVPVGQGWGTLDVTVLNGFTIHVVDLKYGKRPVSASVQTEAGEEPNYQMALYALGALNECGDVADFDRVEVIISQPRVTEEPSRFALPVADLMAWVDTRARPAVSRAKNALTDPRSVTDNAAWVRDHLTPGESQCQYCRAQATCPAARGEVTQLMFCATPASPDEFDALPTPDVAPHLEAVDDAWLAAAFKKLDFAEGFCKAVMAEIERRVLLNGRTLPGIKIVQGRKGPRRWVRPEEAETLLKSLRLKAADMYTLKLISPTQAEKLTPKLDKNGKPKTPDFLIGPRTWPRVAALITQSEGKPHVAAESDPRPAISFSPIADDFEPVALGEPLASLPPAIEDEEDFS